MSKHNDEVDFDFFDTPRNTDSTSPKSPGKYFDRKPPPSPPSNKQGERPTSGIYRDPINNEGKVNDNDSDENSYSDSFSSDTDSETPRVDRGKGSQGKGSQHVVERGRDKRDSYSGSSSAYSNSDYSSDDSFERVNSNNNRKKERIEVTVPKVQMNAWSNDYTGDEMDLQQGHESRKSKTGDKGTNKYNSRKQRSNSSESDSSQEHTDLTDSKKRKDRVKSAKSREDRQKDKIRKPLRSTSSSYSNNSDITDVSPLESPEISPRVVRKRYYDTAEKENGQYEDVQYRSSDREVDIKLESDKIDLSILMKCMADIDKEKQQRLKANTRRVMFAPPTSHEKGNQNYTFSMGRAKMIEKENQRLLKQIMHHVGTGPGKQKLPAKPKKTLHHAEPVIPRLTPSAVNRMREQRRIEMENMQMLQRLQRVRATPGMARNEQLDEFEKQAAYGIPSGTVIVSGDTGKYETTSKRDLGSSMSMQRSRPSSAKSNTSVPGGRRSRPSSAKSNASVISNSSMRSNMSLRSNVSKRSTASMRSVGKSVGSKKDNRPDWDDRFAYS